MYILKILFEKTIEKLTSVLIDYIIKIVKKRRKNKSLQGLDNQKTNS